MRKARNVNALQTTSRKINNIEASGLELCKTYADNSAITKTYDSFGRIATETNARGQVGLGQCCWCVMTTLGFASLFL